MLFGFCSRVLPHKFETPSEKRLESEAVWCLCGSTLERGAFKTLVSLVFTGGVLIRFFVILIPMYYYDCILVLRLFCSIFLLF